MNAEKSEKASTLAYLDIEYEIFPFSRIILYNMEIII